MDKLVEFTEEKHPDRRAIQNARDRISQVAQDINEIKRRKDIGVCVCVCVCVCMCVCVRGEGEEKCV